VSRVPIRFGRLRLLFLLTGITPARSYLELGENTIAVKMAWSFSARFERSAVRRVERTADAPWSIGVHGWGGRWIVNGTAGPMVSIALDRPARARALGVPVTLSELLVSVDDPDALVSKLEPR
jgi:hypothetical protein